MGVIFGSPDVTSGGMALRFYSSVRMEVRKGQPIKQNGELVGTKARNVARDVVAVGLFGHIFVFFVCWWTVFGVGAALFLF